MDIKRAIEILKQYNKWRTDKEIPSVKKMPRPCEITEAINTVVGTYTLFEFMRDKNGVALTFDELGEILGNK